MSVDGDTELEIKRERSPSFPYLELDASLDLIKRLSSAAKNSEVRIADLANFWGTTPTSGALTRYVAALSAYGLIDASGSASARKVKLSDMGKRILQDTRPGIKEQLCEEASLKPNIMREIFELWGFERPDDSIARSQLQFDYRFTTDAARRFLVVYDANLGFIKKGTHAGKEAPLAESSIPSGLTLAREERTEASLSDHTLSPSSPPLVTNMRRDVFAVEEGEITLTMPSIISRESFEDFSDWLDLMKRKVQRSIKRDGDA